MSRPGSKRRRVAALLLVLLALPLVELTARTAALVRGEPYGADAARAQAHAVVSAMRDSVPAPPDQTAARDAPPGGRTLHPYYGWETPRGRQTIHDQVRASEAFAPASELPASEPPASKPIGARAPWVVWVVGGSVAAVFTDVERGGLDRLRQVLRADPRFADRAIEFVGHGRGSFKQPQQLMLVCELLGVGLAPDAVINLDGFNEVAVALTNAEQGVDPTYPAMSQWGALVQEINDPRERELRFAIELAEYRGAELVARADRRGLFHSALLGSWTLKRLAGVREEWGLAQTAYVDYVATSRNPALVGPIELDREAFDPLGVAVRCWLESSLSLDAVCRARGIAYVHVLQPTLHDEGAKPATAEELRNGNAGSAFLHGARKGYPKLRAAGEELVRSGVSFTDATRVFAGVERTLYYDACHFGRDGNELLAEVIGRAVLEALPESMPDRAGRR